VSGVAASITARIVRGKVRSGGNPSRAKTIFYEKQHDWLQSPASQSTRLLTAVITLSIEIAALPLQGRPPRQHVMSSRRNVNHAPLARRPWPL